MRVVVYIIGMPTGQVDKDGVQQVILIDTKLSMLAAEQVQRANPGSIVKKMIADKEVP